MGDLNVVNNISIKSHSEKTILNSKLLLNNHGFTFVEIISVLIIIAIVSGVMVSRMGSDQSDLYSIESLFKGHIRYAQSKSMQSDTAVWGIRINKKLDEYWLFNSNIGQTSKWDTNRRLPPGGTASPANLNQDRIKTSLMKVDIRALKVGSSQKSLLTIVFDEMGVPFWTEGGTMVFLDPLSDTSGLNRLNSNLNIRLTDNSGNTRWIIIFQETGFIQ
jgi:prepilin-type N-terminal cleavage/methylation domain-containing protein